jgi:hypothetical protein
MKEKEIEISLEVSIFLFIFVKTSKLWKNRYGGTLKSFNLPHYQ